MDVLVENFSRIIGGGMEGNGCMRQVVENSWNKKKQIKNLFK
jgi:hypothetical protein